MIKFDVVPPGSEPGNLIGLDVKNAAAWNYRIRRECAVNILSAKLAKQKYRGMPYKHLGCVGDMHHFQHPTTKQVDVVHAPLTGIWKTSIQ